MPVDLPASIKRQATYRSGLVLRFCTTLHEPGRVGLHDATDPVLPMATITDGEAPALMLRLAGGGCLFGRRTRTQRRPTVGTEGGRPTPDNMFEVNVVDVSPPAQTLYACCVEPDAISVQPDGGDPEYLTEPQTPPDHQPAPWSGN